MKAAELLGKKVEVIPIDSELKPDVATRNDLAEDDETAARNGE